METPAHPYSQPWHGFVIYGFPQKIGVCEAYVCRVTREGVRVFDFEGSVLSGDVFALEPALEEHLGELNAKRVALARVRAIIDLRSFTQDETIHRRLFDLKTSSMPRDKLRQRLLGVFYTLWRELPHTYEFQAIDVQGLWMELEVSEKDCESELVYLKGKGWLKDSRVRTGLLDLCITPDGVDEYELRGQPASTRDVFVNYRQDDTLHHLQPLGFKLRTRLGQDRIFIARRDIGAGLWRDRIQTAIRSCKVMLVLIGPQWLTIEDEHGSRKLDDPDDIVRWEIESAFAEEKTVVPVLFEGVEVPDKDQLPDSPLRRLRECHRHPIDPDRWDDDTDELIKALEVELGRPAAGGI